MERAVSTGDGSTFGHGSDLRDFTLLANRAIIINFKLNFHESGICYPIAAKTYEHCRFPLVLRTSCYERSDIVASICLCFSYIVLHQVSLKG